MARGFVLELQHARGKVLFLIRPHSVCKRANQPLENHVHVRAAGDVAAFANNELDPFTQISLDRALHLHKARLNHHHGFALVQRTYIKSPGPGARDIWDVTARVAPGPWPDVRLGVRPGVALRPGPRPPACGAWPNSRPAGLSGAVHNSARARLAAVRHSPRPLARAGRRLGAARLHPLALTHHELVELVVRN